MMPESPENLQFGPFRVSRRDRQLQTAHGKVTLGARAFDLLLVLVDRPGQLVSKQTLIDLVWAGQLVDEGNLHVQIAAIRRALGAHHALVQNIPGRGYRFTGQLIFDPPESAPPLDLPQHYPPDEQIQIKTLIGRDTELSELRAMQNQTRLLSIVGPGGVGKTHLALALLQSLKRQFGGRVQLADLAPLNSGNLIESAILAALDLPSGEAGIAETIAASIDGPSLLLFDNCEHVLAEVAAITEALLGRSPAISIIVTSQEPLRIAGETIFRLDPLAVPPHQTSTALELARFGAAELFVRCVSAADRRFRLNAENGPIIGEICRSLDGIPLALQMAAARAPSLGIGGLRDRLHQRLRVLDRGARTAPARHQTLRNTVTWSYDLLDPLDRTVFRGLGIFSGGFSAEAAAAIIMPQEDEWTVIDALSRLIDKSMVVAGPGEKPRYHLLETLRLFAIDEMAKHNEQQPLAQRHAKCYERQFDEAYQDWESTDDRIWLARMAPELDNLRAGLDWASGNAPGCLVSLAGSAALLWEKLSLFAEGRRYLEQAEAALSAEMAPAITARLHRHIGNLWHSSDRQRAKAGLERAETLYRSLGDQANLGAVLALLGAIRGFLGATDAAAATLHEARLLLRGSGRRKSLFNILNNLGASALINGDMAASREFFEEALIVAKTFDGAERETQVLVNLAEVEFSLGHIEAAVARGLDAVDRLRALDHKADLGWALVNLTGYLLILDRPSEAETAAREALSLVREAGGFILRVCLQQWALLAAIRSNYAEAARLLGFVDFGFEAAGETREHAERQVHERLRDRLSANLNDASRACFTAEGAGWSERHAIDQAAALCAMPANIAASNTLDDDGIRHR